jgi:hypothetical protein
MKARAPHSISNPNVAAGFGNETKDCAVRAMANSFGVPYAYAHAAMKVAGRKERNGTPVNAIHEVVTAEHAGKRGVKIEHIGKGVGQRQVSIGVFCKYHPHGSFYCIVRGHAFAVVNGVVQDSGFNKASRRIYKAYEIV